MILAEMINISINLLMVAHVVISLLLILVVLMQRPKQEGLGAAFGGGMMDSFAGAGTTSFLQKSTVYLGGLFIILSLTLAILIGNRHHQSAMELPGTPEESIEDAPPVPELPGVSLQEEASQLEGAEAPTGEGTAPTEESGTTEGEPPTTPPTEEEGQPAPQEGEDPAPTTPEAETEGEEEGTGTGEETPEEETPEEETPEDGSPQ